MTNNTAEKITFTAHTISVQDQEFPVEYAIKPDGTVTAFVAMQDNGKTVNVRIRFAADHALYSSALAAAEQERAEREQDRAAARGEELAYVAEPASITDATSEAADEPETVTSTEQAQAIIDEFLPEPATTDEIAPEPVDAAPELTEGPEENSAEDQPPVKQRQPKAGKSAKLYIGMEIKGKGWKIYFDPEYDRTRVIFKRKPSCSVRDAVKAAGFYWSPVMKSWNKKLTNKAYMAAQGLAIELRKLCA